MTTPTTMRIAQYTNTTGGLDKTIRINEISVPQDLPDGHTLVKVAFTSLNPADIKIAESFLGYAIKKPATPGFDFSGVVVRTTRKDLKPGQRVFGVRGPPAVGVLSDYIVVGDGLVGLPDFIPLDHAACVGTAGLTAYQSIIPHAPRKVFINGGSGGTGSFGIQIAKAIGAYVVTACSTTNIQLVKDLGADEVIDYKTQDLIAELSKHEFDLIVDNVFNTADTYWAANQFLKQGGTYVTIAGEANWASVVNFMKVYLVPGFLGGGKRAFRFFFTNINQKDLNAIGEWMAEGRVKALIDEKFDLVDVGAAFAKLRTGRTKGKIVIKIGDEE